MTKFVHPTVRRGKILYTMQVLGLAGLTLVAAYYGLVQGNLALLLLALAGVALTALAAFFFAREYRKLRHEYRYEDEEGVARGS
ncbi:hypothetical protein BJ994_000433 [Arthrobacter pigmenti]|uniref:Uncharacterized protein n=1 Tax=Arthrobacter pigmenti TaxID=271432 RepID=A0A846RMJ8_9MICC|nr:hypothetical protein [Arthrobacter pigmenti]NJC21357.1 hypothetical protein [Arthrobacter pigmenti]